MSAAELRRYLESGNASLRRAALTAAPHIGAPQDVLPELLALASSDDAYVAIRRHQAGDRLLARAAGRPGRASRTSAQHLSEDLYS